MRDPALRMQHRDKDVLQLWRDGWCCKTCVIRLCKAGGLARAVSSDADHYNFASDMLICATNSSYMEIYTHG